MKVNNEDEARRLIDELLISSVALQARNLKMAVENLELDQMYYEQKGNDQGRQRCQACLDLLRNRLAELD